MIYGYYCIYPEKVDEHYKVIARKNRIDKLTQLNAPEIILTNERRVYVETKAYLSDIAMFRKSISKLYEDDKVYHILRNYRTVFEDIGYGNNNTYNFRKSDSLKLIEIMSDAQVIDFIRYVQDAFTAYTEKYTEKLEEIRNAYISRIPKFIGNALSQNETECNIERVKTSSIEIDDGFTTTLEGSSGWHNAGRNQTVIAANSFCGADAFVLFHEFAHGSAGQSEEGTGFTRLETFFNEDYIDAFDLMNENYANFIALLLVSRNLPAYWQQELQRDIKIASIIQKWGREEISSELYRRAYFSNNMEDIRILAEAIKRAHNYKSLFEDMLSIKDTYSTAILNTSKINMEDRDVFYTKHRHDSIDAFYKHYSIGTGRLKPKFVFNSDDEFIDFLFKTLKNDVQLNENNLINE